MMAPEPAWQPANDAERDLLRALSAGDQAGYFTVLAKAPLYLPGAAMSGATQQLATWARDGTTYLLAFTSLDALVRCTGTSADVYWTTDYDELARRWPDPAWRLGVNPTVPIGAFLGVGDIARGAAGDLTIATLDDLLQRAAGTAGFQPAND